jgi:hypothetical protein
MTQTRKSTNILIVLVVLATIAATGALVSYAQETDDTNCGFGTMFGRGGMGGMMGNADPTQCAQLNQYNMGMMGGMMMGRMGMMGSMMEGNFGSGMMGEFGPSTAMMGAWNPPADLAPVGDTLTLSEAAELAETYIAAWDTETPLKLGEVMEFNNHFYAQAIETESGVSAFEFLIDPVTGVVMGEPGPNMMWNLRYGMMGRGMGLSGSATGGETLDIAPETAQELAQTYLDEVLPGTQVDEEADTFYGYYTLHVLQDGETIGMLSVNGFSGQVWLHHWHGDFVTMTEHA